MRLTKVAQDLVWILKVQKNSISMVSYRVDFTKSRGFCSSALSPSCCKWKNIYNFVNLCCHTDEVMIINMLANLAMLINKPIFP